MAKKDCLWYVYILTNPSFRDDWVKIWKSSRPVNIRSKELDNTAVPLPFEIYATMQTAKYEKVEKLVHKSIDRLTDLRIRKSREFFNIKPEEALEIFYDIAETLDDAIIEKYHTEWIISKKVQWKNNESTEGIWYMNYRNCNWQLKNNWNEFIIQKWSIWNLRTLNSMVKWRKKEKEELIKNWTIKIKWDKIQFTKNYSCKSWSEAAALLAGASINWKTSWKLNWKTVSDYWL